MSFVGAGPGDASLLTVRAAELLAQADIVITELPEQSALVTNGAEIVDGGIGEDGETLTHAARGRLVVKHAKTGARVVRLIAGDPFTYATGPEEAAACNKAGIGFEIVPGISSVSAVPAYAGVPLTNRTHREYSVVSVGDSTINWADHAGDDTLVLLSAVARIGEVAAGLVDAGRKPETPVAMTRVGTTTEQTTVVSTLAAIAADAKAAGMTSPAITVVGEVVTMREALSWFETKPLYGWR
ncbi:MAG: uroporphyrinogen-III C-methyltransferase, partial [Aeromicrobium sp.]